jgi:site-specific DNA recombinase
LRVKRLEMQQKNQHGVPAFGYARMSTDQQDQSPAQQRERIAKLASERGFEIVDWFVDEGITGDSIEARPQFARMLSETASRDVKAILVWDLSRFGRFDIFDAVAVIRPLRDAGVKLVTVAEGAIDWDEFAGQMMFMLQAGGNHKFLKDISRNVTRGRWAARERGSFLNATPPGIVRVFFDAAGNEMARSEWNERFKRAAGWSCRIAISDDPAREHEREAVRWAFHQYAYAGASLRKITIELARRGLVNTVGTRVSASTLGWWLSNPKYIGRVVLGRFACGKYHRTGKGGEIIAVGPKDQKRGRHGLHQPIGEMHLTCPQLIPEETFFAVQRRRIAEYNDGRRGRPHSKSTLTGRLWCGVCGSRMHARSSGGRVYLECQGGADGSMGRCAFAVRAEPVEDYAVRLAVALIDATGDARRIEDAIERRAASVPKPRRDLAKRRLAEIESQIKQGQRNLLRVGPDDVAAVTEMLDGLRDQREALDAEIRGISKNEIRRKAVRASGAVGDLEEALSRGDRVQVGRVMRSVFRSVTLRFRRLQGRARLFEGGLAEIRLGVGALSALPVEQNLEILKSVQLLRSARLIDSPEGRLLAVDFTPADMRYPSPRWFKAVCAVRELYGGKPVPSNAVAKHLGEGLHDVQNDLQLARRRGLIEGSGCDGRPAQRGYVPKDALEAPLAAPRIRPRGPRRHKKGTLPDGSDKRPGTGPDGLRDRCTGNARG